MTEEQKEWLGDGYYDIDLMIRLGVFTEEFCLQMLVTLLDSPWRKA